jgi:hypothetical protein
MRGTVKPRERVWARLAAKHVPLPAHSVTIAEGIDLEPMFYPARWEIDLPEPGKGGWTLLAEKGLFLHELGHAFDYANMTPDLRRRFEATIKVHCAWRARHCKTARWVSGPDVYVDVPPVEMFAEEYAACALGLTQEGYQNAGYNTYGWVPPKGTDESLLCGLIRTAA